MVDFFPLSLAGQPAFCNRTKETEYLLYNIEHARPTLIMSPRRYGKSSLVHHVISKSKACYACVDFYKLISEQDIRQSIFNAIASILSQIETKPEKLMRLAQDLFSQMQVSLSYRGAHAELSIHHETMRVADALEQALTALHDFLLKKNTIAVFFIDEFQKLVSISKDHSIEAAFREVAQKSQSICFIYAGSNRHLLESMFFDSNRPFYRLCDTMHLARIEAKHYHPYINKAAKARWNEPLPEDVFEKIIDLTQCHSYYVNLLCSELWRKTERPSNDDVKATWHECALIAKAMIENELDLLSDNQRKVLVAVAKLQGVASPNAKAFVRLVDLSPSSINQSLRALLQKDFLYQNEDGYALVDPLMQFVLM